MVELKLVICRPRRGVPQMISAKTRSTIAAPIITVYEERLLQ